jgi:nitrogen fixation NifU-like protein
MTGDARGPALSELYQELILEHYKRPRNKGELEDADVEMHLMNTSCGDEVRLQLRLANGIIQEARYQGNGCSISQASISMMSGLLRGKTIPEAIELAQRFTDMMHGDPAAAREKRMGDLRALAGVSQYPVRVKCALLGWDALLQALRKLGGEEADHAQGGTEGRDRGGGADPLR